MKAQSIRKILLTLALVAGAITAAQGTAAAQSASKKTNANSKSAAAAHKTNKRKPKVRAQMAPTAARISEIQGALATHGTYQGEATGKWDDNTVDAMKKFQSSQGLTATGKLDAISLEKLGLGADTAGRGAPVRGATSEPNLLISRTQAAAALSNEAPVQGQPSDK